MSDTVRTNEVTKTNLEYVSRRRKGRGETVTSKAGIVAELSKKEADKERRKERNKNE